MNSAQTLATFGQLQAKKTKIARELWFERGRPYSFSDPQTAIQFSIHYKFKEDPQETGYDFTQL